MQTPSLSSRLSFGCLLIALACACRAAAEPNGADAQPVLGLDAGSESAPGDIAEWFTARSEAGHFELAWRPVGGGVPRNEEFAMEVRLMRDGSPLSGPRVTVRGWMPDHSHGLVRAPLVTDRGDGRYEVKGLLLHMRGLWRVMFDVSDGVTADTVTFELTL